MNARTSAPLIATTLAVSLGLLVGCSGEKGANPSRDEAKPVAGGTLVVASRTETTGLDPLMQTTPGSGPERAEAIFDTLTMTEPDGSVRPELARSLESSSDGRTWTLGLREGLTFTDHTPLDADAVIFNIRRHTSADSTSTGKALLADLTDLTAPDRLTVKFTFSHPFGSFPAVLSDQANLGFIGSPTAIRKDPAGFARHPVGAGPFMLHEWVPDDHMTVVKNPDYWDKGRPYLDKIVFNVVPDPQARAQALQSGGADWATTVPALSWIPFKGDATYKVLLGGAPGGQSIAWNMSKAPGNNIDLRHAVALAFDPKTSSTVLTGKPDTFGADDIDCTPFAKTDPACLNGDLPTRDLPTAKDLVSKYLASGGSRTIQLTYTATIQPLAEYVQQTLNDLGLDVKIVAPPTEQIPSIMRAGDFEVGIVGQGQSPFFPRNFQYWYSKGQNRLQTTALDASLEKAKDSLSPQDRVTAYHEMQKLMNGQYMTTWISPLTDENVSLSTVHSPLTSTYNLPNWAQVWKER